MARFIFHKQPATRNVDNDIKTRAMYVSAAPIVEYTIATGFSPGIAGNVAFKNSVIKQTNTSSFLGAIKYTQKKQFLLPVQSTIWTTANKYNLQGDWRYLNYSQDTYGLGGHTTAMDKYTVTYQYLRIYEYSMKHLGSNFYFGLGYQLDYHWQIKESIAAGSRLTDFEKYGFNKSSVSSGIGLAIVYDTRENSINPEGGSGYGKIQFVRNTTLLASSTNWNSLLVELRKYLKVGVHNVLAFWYYSMFTLGGRPPYLDLPGTGSDTYNNTGRGYEQSRFSGRNLVYLETEYRFAITKNGLLGGVIFSNAESVAEPGSGKFTVVLPGAGAGLRIQFNKFSKTNACIDYGVGIRGSHGFVGNLGEVF